MNMFLDWFWNLGRETCMLLAFGLTWIAIGLGTWACCLAGRTADERVKQALEAYMEREGK